MTPPSFSGGHSSIDDLVGPFTVRTFAAFLAFFASSVFVAGFVRPTCRLAAGLVRPTRRLAATFVRPALRLAATFVRPAYGLIAAIRVGLAVMWGSDGIVHVSCSVIGSLS